MKDGMDSTAARQAPERTQEEEFVSRKLIRPSLSSPAPRTEPVSERRERLERTDRAPSVIRRNGPPEQTHAENYYYQKQIQGKTPVVVVLKDGEEVQGIIEWYDRNCIKVNRSSASALLIYKPSIRYIYKAGEGTLLIPQRCIPSGPSSRVFLRATGRNLWARSPALCASGCW